MLRIFRSAWRERLGEREGQSYLKYAIGEIALVVIGILIALQINNWNEDRLDRKKEREYLAAMLSDLREDVVAMDAAVRGNGILLAGIGDLLELLSEPLDESAAQRKMFLHSLVHTYWYLRVDFSELAMFQLKNSGDLLLIQNPDVRRAMLKYDQGLTACKHQYTLIRHYFHAYEATQTQLLNMRLSTQVYARIEDNYLNMLEPLESFEPLVPEGPYLIDHDPKLLAIYYTDLMFYRTALDEAVTFVQKQRLMAEALIDLIQAQYGIE
jgi:hypothetical protein